MRVALEVGAYRIAAGRRTPLPQVAGSRTLVDAGDGEMDFIAHHGTARGNGIEARRQRPQGGQQFTGQPFAAGLHRKALQDIRHVGARHEGLQARGSRRRLVEHGGEFRRARAFGLRLEKRPRQTRDFQLLAQPFAERAFLLATQHRGFQCRTGKMGGHTGHDRWRIQRPHTQRVAGFVGKAFTSLQFVVHHGAVRLAGNNALGGQDGHLARVVFVGVASGAGRKAESDRRRGAHGWRRHGSHRRRHPGLGLVGVFHIRIHAAQQAPRTQRGEAFIQEFARLAEQRVAGIAKTEHRKRRIRELRRLAAGKQFPQATRLVRRLAFPLRARHGEERPRGGQLLGIHVGGADHLHGLPSSDQGLAEFFTEPARVPGLGSRQYHHVGSGRCSRYRRGTGRSPAGLGKARQIACRPPEAGRAESGSEVVERSARLGVERQSRREGVLGHRPGMVRRAPAPGIVSSRYGTITRPPTAAPPISSRRS